MEAYRLHLLRGLESSLFNCGYDFIAGVDEAGRGCLAGPVVAAAVVVDPRSAVPGVDDSKRLDAASRERLAPEIRRSSLAVACAASSAATIDQINVLEATRLAMRKALEQLEVRPDLALVDAVPLRGPCPVLPVVRGDSLSYAIACASIIAKRERDRFMEQIDSRYPQYGFAANKGYGAPGHRQALVELGPTPIHRLTFRSVIPRRP